MIWENHSPYHFINKIRLRESASKSHVLLKKEPGTDCPFFSSARNGKKHKTCHLQYPKNQYPKKQFSLFIPLGIMEMTLRSDTGSGGNIFFETVRYLIKIPEIQKSHIIPIYYTTNGL